jgi:hypothetical protein
MKEYKWITVRSDFHGTKTRMRAELMHNVDRPNRTRYVVSNRQVHEAWRRVCGLSSCLCGTQYKMDGNPVELMPTAGEMYCSVEDWS